MILTLSRLARRAVGIAGTALLVTLVGFSVSTHLAPLSGRELFIIIGGSMEPAIPIGSLVVTAPTDPATVVAGDVLTIRGDSGVAVTHRVRSSYPNNLDCRSKPSSRHGPLKSCIVDSLRFNREHLPAVSDPGGEM